MPVRLKFNDKELRKLVDRQIESVVAETGDFVELTAKAHVTRNSQVDTGFMRASVYTNASNGNTTYDIRLAQAKAREETYTMGPQIFGDEKQAVVAVGASYGVYQESKESFLYRALERSEGAPTESIIARVAARDD